MEIAYADEHGLTYKRYHEFFGEFMRDFVSMGLLSNTENLNNRMLSHVLSNIFIDHRKMPLVNTIVFEWCRCAIIFTGIGENAVNVRSSIINGISWFTARSTLLILELSGIFLQMIPV